MNAVETSIIIRTFNESRHVGRLLDSILAQEYGNREIIVVDSGSTDDTLAIAAKYPVKIITIRKEDFSFGYSLNVGCRNASGAYLVFVSAHTYPVDNRWLRNMIGPFEDPKIGMVYGRQIGNETTKISEEKDMFNNFGDKSRILVDESLGNNANAAVRKSLWLQTPFDETLPGIEDIDWARKIQKAGYYVYYKADAVICHIHDETCRQIYNRFRREAIAYRMIYPGGSTNTIEDTLVSGLVINTLRDVKFGLSSKKPLRKILAAFPYRWAEYRGCRDGYLHASSLNQDLKKELYFHAGSPSRELKKEFCFPGKNRTLVISDPNRHRIEERDIPVPEADEVLINVRYVGVCGTDLDVLAGTLDYYRSGWAMYPIVPGHEFSGVVAAAGSGEETRIFAVGDKVVGECIMGCGVCGDCLGNRPVNCKERKEVGVLNFNGAYADYITMPARFVHKLPEDASLERACLIEPLAVSLKGINKLLAGEGRDMVNAAVLGCGTIGNFCAQLIRARGSSVTVFDRNASRLAGITKGNISGQTIIENLDRYDTIIEATGNPEVLEKVLEESATGVTILLLGLPYAKIKYNFESLVAFDKTLVGSLGSSKKEFTEAIGMYRGLNMKSLTGNIFPFEDYETAWRKQQSGEIAKALISTGKE